MKTSSVKLDALDLMRSGYYAQVHDNFMLYTDCIWILSTQ